VDVNWVAIIVTIVIAVIGGLVAHILHDAKAHERIAKVETEVETLKEEQGRTRESIHRLRDDMPRIIKDLVEWFWRDKKP